jgi:hypothetical protein
MSPKGSAHGVWQLMRVLCAWCSEKPLKYINESSVRGLSSSRCRCCAWCPPKSLIFLKVTARAVSPPYPLCPCGALWAPRWAVEIAPSALVDLAGGRARSSGGCHDRRGHRLVGHRLEESAAGRASAWPMAGPLPVSHGADAVVRGRRRGRAIPLFGLRRAGRYRLRAALGGEVVCVRVMSRSFTGTFSVVMTQSRACR